MADVLTRAENMLGHYERRQTTNVVIGTVSLIRDLAAEVERLRQHPQVVVTAEDVYSAMSAAYTAMEGAPMEASDSAFEQLVAEALTARLNREGE